MIRMRFLVDADLPRSTASFLASFGHQAADVRDVGMREADDPTIAAYAKKHGLCLLSGDSGFADTRSYPPSDYQGLA
jgi:predicted nuclease of predicted toxin-antitoxin system